MQGAPCRFDPEFSTTRVGAAVDADLPRARVFGTASFAWACRRLRLPNVGIAKHVSIPKRSTGQTDRPSNPNLLIPKKAAPACPKKVRLNQIY